MTHNLLGRACLEPVLDWQPPRPQNVASHAELDVMEEGARLRCVLDHLDEIAEVGQDVAVEQEDGEQ